MNRRRAIEWIDARMCFGRYSESEHNPFQYDECCEAGGMAIVAINKTTWIPVEERLPEKDEMVLVTCQTKKGVKSVNRAYCDGDFWHGSGSMSGVIAWMPLPDPYEKEESEIKEHSSEDDQKDVHSNKRPCDVCEYKELSAREKAGTDVCYLCSDYDHFKEEANEQK